MTSRDPELDRRTVLGATLALASASCAKRADARPNLLLLLTDDQRWDTLGCMGNPVIRTPEHDRLAAEGVVFDNAFVTTSVCPTSRASILTGQYARRHKVQRFGMPLPRAALALSYPTLLRDAGYFTGFVGKWGIGGGPQQAFDVWSGQDETSYFDEASGQHLTSRLAHEAASFLRTAATRSAPFCLSVSFKAPHVPWREFDPALRELYENEDMPLPATATLADAERAPRFLDGSLSRIKGLRWCQEPDTLRAEMRDYYRLITGVDRALGTIRAELARLGLDDDTVVVATSDNGMLLGDHGLNGKWLMYEPSIRIPLLYHDPRLPQAARGTRRDAMALNIDLAPTLLDLAGLPSHGAMQGTSLLPLVDDARAPWRSEWFYEFVLDIADDVDAEVVLCEGVRTERYKFVRYIGRPREDQLFDLATDPLERHNLARSQEHASELGRLRRKWKELRAQAL